MRPSPRSFFRLLTLFVAFLLINSACERRSESPVKDSAVADSLRSAELPDQESENTRITQYIGSAKSADIYARRVWKFSRLDSTHAFGLAVDLYDSSGSISTHILADSGYIWEVRNSITALGHVVVTTADSSVLRSDELTWNNNSQLITSTKFVHIVSDGDTLQGVGFESDREMKRIKILKRVSGALARDRKSRVDTTGAPR